MRRGEIRLTDLGPALGNGAGNEAGNEAGRRRPAVIVSNDRANATATRLGRGVVTVVPVTSKTTRVGPFQVLLRHELTGLRVDAKAQAEQLRAVTVERIGPVLGTLPPGLVTELDDALRLHLDL